MMEEFIPIVMFIVLAFIVKTIPDNSTRRYIVKEGNVNEDLKYLFMDQQNYGVPSSLKWGIVFIAVGAAILVGQFVPADDKELFIFSAMFIAGGLGLLLYYFIAKREIAKQEPKQG